MTRAPGGSDGETSEDSQFRQAIQKLEEIVCNGVQHGFFECTIASEVIKGEKRRLVIKAGVSHLYVISPEEIQRL